MIENTATQINSVIDHLADKLAVPAGKLMEIVPQMGVKDLASAVVAAVCIVASLLAMWLGVRLIIKGCEDNGDLNFCVGTMSALGGAIAAVISAVAFFANVGDAILWLYSPQAWAVKYIIDLLH